MNSLELLEKLKRGDRVYGTLIVSTSPRWSEEVKNLDIDFVFLDSEHMPLDRDQLSWMCHTYRALDLAPLVRIPSPDPYQASMALDGGAAGIIAPYIETVEQVEALRGAVKFRPLKGQKLQRILNRKETPEEPLAGYLRDFNAENVLIVNIESKPALDALDEILQVPQLDAVLVGPHDLSCSLGVPEQYQHPLFLEAVDTIIRKARANGVAAGMHYFWGVEQEIKWLKQGLNLLIHASDITAFRSSMSRDIRAIKESVGDESKQKNHQIHI